MPSLLDQPNVTIQGCKVTVWPELFDENTFRISGYCLTP